MNLLESVLIANTKEFDQAKLQLILILSNYLAIWFVCIVSILQEIILPPPHGDYAPNRKLLYFDHYTQAACYRECITNFVVDICGCRDYYMPPFHTGW